MSLKTSYKVADIALCVVGIAMIAFHMISTQVLFISSYQFQDIHLIFILLLIFLSSIKKATSFAKTTFYISLALASIIAAGYVFINVDQLQIDAGFPTAVETIFGVVLIIVVFEATRQAWGLILPIVALISIIYYIFGSSLTGPLRHPTFSFDYIVSNLSIGLSGIYGTFLSISANMVFLFVIFGALISATKVNDLFDELGKATGRVFRGGPAQSSVIASSLIGMVSGAAVANIATVGSFTIPYMKRVGFSSEVSGAIEANASTGGQIMPPVMGASAFLMATFVGVPYATIMLAGIIPALLFYWSCILGVQFLAIKYNIDEKNVTINWRIVYSRFLLFFIPLSVLIILLLKRYSPGYSAFWAIITVFCLSMLSKSTRPSFNELIQSLTQGAITGARIGITLVIIGMVARTVISTGLGAKFAGLVVILSGGDVIIALMLTMAVALILGMGVPTTAAYSLVAIIVVPSLVGLGVGLLEAHFFAFYFAVVSALSPPVALASLTAAGIAGGDYLKTALHAFRLGIPGFVIPYLIIYNPLMLFKFDHLWFDLLTVVTLFTALMLSTACLFKCGLARLTWTEWMFTAIGAIALYCFLFRSTTALWGLNSVLIAVGYLSALFVIGTQMARNKINKYQLPA